MNKFLLRAFEGTLILFALSVALTMFSMATGDEESQQLWGLNYSYYLVPLLGVNLLIIFSHLSAFRLGGMNKYVLIWMIWVSLSALLISRNHFLTLIRVSIWTTSYFAAYILARSNRKAIDSIVKVFVIIYIISFFFFWQGKIVQSVEFKYGFESTSNAIYCLVTIIPILMLLKKKWLVLIIMLLTFVSTIFSGKRGATLILLFTLVPQLKSIFSKKKKSTGRTVLMIVLVVALTYLLFYVSQNVLSGTLMNRFADDETGSGRTFIWLRTLNAFDSSAFFEQLFGHGYYAVNSLGEASAAHNDFIEVLYDYGLLGLLIYTLIHVYLVVKTFKLRKSKKLLFLPYMVMYMVFFIMSMVSILIVQQRYLIYMAVFWGMLEGCNYNYQYQISDSKK